jgi:hypothetical protein
VGVTLVLVARVPADGVAEFEAYEGRLLPVLAEHGGRLERRLRSSDARTEVHVVSFEAGAGFAAYLEDPRRAELAPLLARSGAAIELLEVEDVAALPGPAPSPRRAHSR